MSLLPSETWRENEFQRGYRNGKEAIKQRGFERASSDWENHNWGDDYDHGFKRALVDHEKNILSGENETTDR